MKPNPRGAAAEDAACRFLARHGIRVVRRNYHCRWGEIDVIAEDQGTLVFVEVRIRARADYGGPLASVTPRKQGRLRRTALAYLRDTAQDQRSCRFDVLGFEDLQQDPQWLQNAIDTAY